MTPENFIKKWENSTLKERSASQSHFNDLCSVLDVENPIDADQKGDWYCFERGASKTAGGEGWADVWKKGHFGWEYKGKRKDLKAAFAQLQQYAVALENPPLLVVSDMDRIIVHTNWTNTVSETHEIKLEELGNPHKRELLRWVFLDPNRLRPQKTIDALTREVADKFASLAIRLHDRGFDPKMVAHFVNRLVFCMFAEDINLLPRQLFTQILDRSHTRPELSEKLFSQLFASMKRGGLFGVDEIKWFNGGLFDDATAIALTRDELELVGQAAALDWADIDPSIFGTLFERGLDPAKRSQLGAHYTDPEKIMMIVRPVIIDPLWREWEVVKASIQKPRTSAKRKQELLNGFLERLKTFRVLDPACGSGNFLYLALLALKDIEHRVNLDAEAMGFGKQLPTVGPEAVQGIELNPYAAELARVTVWIGEIQWMRKNGFGVSENPILKSLENIQCKDALLDDEGAATVWPDADVIIGNPPFLGSRKMQPELGQIYVSKLRATYGRVVPDGADFVCFWFYKADVALGLNAKYAGFVSTNSISGGQSREVLKPIFRNNHVFRAWSDEPWTVDGASVRVAITCFTRKGMEKQSSLDGIEVDEIFSDLTARTGTTGANLTLANKLSQNTKSAFQGVVPRGSLNKSDALRLGLPLASFVVDLTTAKDMLAKSGNPNRRPNSDVVVPYLVGDELVNRPLDRFIIDFNELSEFDASMYEAPFAYIKTVKLHRAQMNQPEALQLWWRHWNPRPAMRAKLAGLKRYIATARVSKHRVFRFVPKEVLPDNMIIAVPRDDDTIFGILHSRFHELWSLRLCTFLGVGNDPRYTPSTTFETFPFPVGLEPDKSPSDYATDIRAQEIDKAAARLNEYREKWLNPSELILNNLDPALGYPVTIEPRDTDAKRELQSRTLTKLYNSRPEWLNTLHNDLDAAVAHAYGWPVDISDDDAVQRLLELNLARSKA
ncbi:class I SAM-dependent DNA methyltransferase [Methylobacterium sp. WL12]|uniref:class I SAM-dependent DNA methyltransferase n=1 Tax=Methylobacterium sp. WL12 TaxID=2603890 RepID=UPI0011CA14A0|nr:DNA methyltransferase [Methylobacterium sp. WL12]TXM64958.1 class I SAM-dependent DNA methyltransferase [Methylobacterium sp. WL12]